MNHHTDHRQVSAGRKAVSCILLTVFLLVVVFVFCRIPVSGASGKKASVTYISVQIQHGDTLWGLAEQYKDQSEDTRRFIDSIRSINHMSPSDPIIASEYLIIPVHQAADGL